MVSDRECCHTLHLVQGIEIGNRIEPTPLRLFRSPLPLDDQCLLLVEGSDQRMSTSLLLFVLTSAEPFQTNLQDMSEQQESRNGCIPGPACQKATPRQELKNLGRFLSSVPAACVRTSWLWITKTLVKPTGHRNLCDLCKPTARGSETVGPTPPRCVGHRGRPGYIGETRRVGAVQATARRWTVRRCKEGRDAGRTS